MRLSLALRRSLPLAASLCTLAAASPSAASGPPVPSLDYHTDWQEHSDRDADPKPDALQLLNYFFLRATVTNQIGDPSGLKGVSLGPLGAFAGSSTRTAPDTQTFYVEQRWIPVISYSPSFVDGLATFRAQFEVDFTWGLAANQVQQNQGGGLNVDQVNIQTKNVNVALYPTRDPEQLAIVLGAQGAYDSIYDPATTPLFDLVKTGYKLSFFGTDAVGGAIYGRLGGIWKLSLFPFGSAQPDKALKDDPRFSYACLATADYAYPIMPGTVVGVSAWHLQDDTKGAAYAYEGLVLSGPASTSLGSNLKFWRYQLDLFARKGHRVIALDLPGYGKSDKPASFPYTMESFADVVRELARALAIEHPILVGHSMGGHTALAYAVRWPDEPRALVLTGHMVQMDCADRYNSAVESFLSAMEKRSAQ
jgi:hypothetical protein